MVDVSQGGFGSLAAQEAESTAPWAQMQTPDTFRGKDGAGSVPSAESTLEIDNPSNASDVLEGAPDTGSKSVPGVITDYDFFSFVDEDDDDLRKKVKSSSGEIPVEDSGKFKVGIKVDDAWDELDSMLADDKVTGQQYADIAKKLEKFADVDEVPDNAWERWKKSINAVRTEEQKALDEDMDNIYSKAEANKTEGIKREDTDQYKEVIRREKVFYNALDEYNKNPNDNTAAAVRDAYQELKTGRNGEAIINAKVYDDKRSIDEVYPNLGDTRGKFDQFEKLERARTEPVQTTTGSIDDDIGKLMQEARALTSSDAYDEAYSIRQKWEDAQNEALTKGDWDTFEKIGRDIDKYFGDGDDNVFLKIDNLSKEKENDANSLSKEETPNKENDWSKEWWHTECPDNDIARQAAASADYYLDNLNAAIKQGLAPSFGQRIVKELKELKNQAKDDETVKFIANLMYKFGDEIQRTQVEYGNSGSGEISFNAWTPSKAAETTMDAPIVNAETGEETDNPLSTTSIRNYTSGAATYKENDSDAVAEEEESAEDEDKKGILAFLDNLSKNNIRLSLLLDAIKNMTDEQLVEAGYTPDAIRIMRDAAAAGNGKDQLPEEDVATIYNPDASGAAGGMNVQSIGKNEDFNAGQEKQETDAEKADADVTSDGNMKNIRTLYRNQPHIRRMWKNLKNDSKSSKK